MTISDAPRFKRYTTEIRAAMLVEAGLACLAEGGITGFTIDNICRKAGASRGLVAHHFGSKDGLLAAVYAAAYAPLLADLTPDLDLSAVFDRLFSPAHFTKATLNVWLALWGEVAVNPDLQAEHRCNYATFRATVARAITAHAIAPTDARDGTVQD